MQLPWPCRVHARKDKHLQAVLPWGAVTGVKIRLLKPERVLPLAIINAIAVLVGAFDVNTCR
jgi:hypothetical protein